MQLPRTYMSGSDPVKVNRALASRTRWRRVELARTTLERGARHAARTVVNQAKAGDLKAAKWLLEHVETTDDTGATLRPIAPGVDTRGGNVLAPAAPEGPRIVIGVSLGRDFAQLNTATPARLNAHSEETPGPAIDVTHRVSHDA